MSNVFGPKKPLFGPYTYRVKQNSNGDTLIAVYHGSKRVAHIDAYWAYSMRAIEEHEAEEAQRVGGRGRRLVCASDLRALGAEGRYPNVLRVGHAFMDDEAYKGKGIGRAMYEAMMGEGFAVRQTRIGGQPGPMFLIPDECGGAGNTSADAKRVWASLARDYPSQGTSIRVDAPPVIGSRAKPNPRRRNPAPTSDAFKEWFRNSKVVDAEGNPLVVYHAGFDVLRSSEGAFRVSYSGRAGMGIYFTPSLSGAERYLGRAHAMHHEHVKIAKYDGLPVPTPPAITAAYLSVQNPAIVDRSEAGGREPSEMLASMVVPKRRYRNLDYELEDLLRYTRKAGYDGVFVTNGEEVEEILVFDPRQIKSATANRGTFDPAEPDLRRNPRSRTRRTRSRR